MAGAEDHIAEIGRRLDWTAAEYPPERSPASPSHASADAVGKARPLQGEPSRRAVGVVVADLDAIAQVRFVGIPEDAHPTLTVCLTVLQYCLTIFLAYGDVGTLVMFNVRTGTIHDFKASLP
jgi:hypothetical protein